MAEIDIENDGVIMICFDYVYFCDAKTRPDGQSIFHIFKYLNGSDNNSSLGSTNIWPPGYPESFFARVFKLPLEVVLKYLIDKGICTDGWFPSKRSHLYQPKNETQDSLVHSIINIPSQYSPSLFISDNEVSDSEKKLRISELPNEPIVRKSQYDPELNLEYSSKNLEDPDFDKSEIDERSETVLQLTAEPNLTKLKSSDNGILCSPKRNNKLLDKKSKGSVGKDKIWTVYLFRFGDPIKRSLKSIYLKILEDLTYYGQESSTLGSEQRPTSLSGKSRKFCSSISNNFKSKEKMMFTTKVLPPKASSLPSSNVSNSPIKVRKIYILNKSLDSSSTCLPGFREKRKFKIFHTNLRDSKQHESNSNFSPTKNLPQQLQMERPENHLSPLEEAEDVPPHHSQSKVQEIICSESPHWKNFCTYSPYSKEILSYYSYLVGDHTYSLPPIDILDVIDKHLSEWSSQEPYNLIGNTLNDYKLSDNFDSECSRNVENCSGSTYQDSFVVTPGRKRRKRITWKKLEAHSSSQDSHQKSEKLLPQNRNIRGSKKRNVKCRNIKKRSTKSRNLDKNDKSTSKSRSKSKNMSKRSRGASKNYSSTSRQTLKATNNCSSVKSTSLKAVNKSFKKNKRLESVCKASRSRSMKNKSGSNEEEVNFKCDMCEFSSSRFASLKRHKFIHIEIVQYSCSKCDFWSENSRLAEKHEVVHGPIIAKVKSKGEK